MDQRHSKAIGKAIPAGDGVSVPGKGNAGKTGPSGSSGTPREPENSLLTAIVFIFILISLDRISSGAAMVSGIGSCNPGVSFGLLSDVPAWVWIVLALPVIIYFIVRILRGPVAGRMRWGVYIFLSGAISNVIARLLYGCVWDWLEVGFLDFSFTLADVYIDIGLAWMLLGVISSLRDNGKP